MLFATQRIQYDSDMEIKTLKITGKAYTLISYLDQLIAQLVHIQYCTICNHLF